LSFYLIQVVLDELFIINFKWKVSKYNFEIKKDAKEIALDEA